MGGVSAEREISLKTGEAIVEALRKKGYDVCPIDVGYDVAERLIGERIGIAFIALHGRLGEDGTIQGLLEMMRVPYTGSGVLASALSMVNLSLPIVVKPASEGSTIGVAISRDRGKLAQAIEHARQFDRRVLLEEYIVGKEITLGVLDGQPLPIIEIVPKDGFYDYRAKYTKGETDYVLPPRIPQQVQEEATEIGIRAYNTLGCEGCARVDMMADKQGKPFVLEVNSMPGMTATSLVPKAARFAGIEFPELVERILQGASLKVEIRG